jgi:hypothetical protein
MMPIPARKNQALHYRAAQPAVPADRFAHKIGGILAVAVARLRRLNGKPLGAVQIKKVYHS